MNFFKLTLIFLPVLLLNNCTDESLDCMCTEEFRTYLVVVDAFGNPVDSLQTTIKNDQGKECNVMAPALRFDIGYAW